VRPVSSKRDAPHTISAVLDDRLVGAQIEHDDEHPRTGRRGCSADRLVTQASRFMMVRMSAFPSGFMRVLGRSVLAAALASVLLCATASAGTIGYLYTSIGSGIDEFSIGSDTSLTYAGAVAGGPTTPSEYPGSLVMAKTADGENLYQLAGTGKTTTIYQFSIDPSTGAASAKTPASVGSIGGNAPGDRNPLAVFNPAATGAAGQNAVYVLSDQNAEHAQIDIFDIDPTTGALTSAEEVLVPDVRVGVGFAYSGDVLVVTGGDAEGHSIFQRAIIDASTGTPVFTELAEAPCGTTVSPCDPTSAPYMLDEDHMLIRDPFVPEPESFEKITIGFSAFEVGGSWNALGSSAAHRWGGAQNITSNGHEYLVIDHQIEYEKVSQDGEPDTGETGIEAISSDGLSEGFILLPLESSKFFGPTGIYSLGSGFYIANGGGSGYVDGGAYRLAAGKLPESTELDKPLGTAMTGFLLAGSAGPGPGGPGAGSSETPAAGSGTTPAAGSGSSGTPAAGAQIKGVAGAVIKAIGLSGGGSAKLGSGVIKLDVTCGLPCTVSGFVLPPGAKAASAHKKPKALPFKSVRLSGSGKPVVVTLRFTTAQKQLAAALLRKHEKVTAKITVTEGPGGAAPQSRSIRIT
jgi:hypothetical protein